MSCGPTTSIAVEDDEEEVEGISLLAVCPLICWVVKVFEVDVDGKGEAMIAWGLAMACASTPWARSRRP